MSHVHNRTFGSHSKVQDRPGTPAVKNPCLGVTSPYQTLHQKRVPATVNLPRLQVDLLMLNPPMTPITQELKEILTPLCVSNIVPLNTVTSAEVKPLFIVHPITGKNSFQTVSGLFSCYIVKLSFCFI